MNLPNPFIDSAVAPATVAGSAAGLRTSDPAAPAAAKFNSVALMLSSPAEVAAVASSPGAAAVVVSESAASLPALDDRTDTAGAATADAAPAVFSPDDTQHIPELFSAYAYRHSMKIISPPRDAGRIGLAAVHRALNLHPRDLDDDPAPLFLRKPRPAFMRALLQLAGDAR